VRLLFDDPDLNLRAQYTLFDRVSGRPVCVGNGETCRRATASGVQTLPCPSPESCEWNGDRGCKPFGRLNVRIDVEDQEGDPTMTNWAALCLGPRGSTASGPWPPG
jgi:hypothetical protein